MAHHAAGIISTFRPQATSNTLWAFAKLGHCPCEPLLRAAAAQMTLDLNKSVPQDISNGCASRHPPAIPMTLCALLRGAGSCSLPFCGCNDYLSQKPCLLEHTAHILFLLCLARGACVPLSLGVLTEPLMRLVHVLGLRVLPAGPRGGLERICGSSTVLGSRVIKLESTCWSKVKSML